MKKLRVYFTYIIIQLCLLNTVFAQQQQSEETPTKKNELAISINHQNKLNFYGRTDSLKSSGLFPTINFQLKNGLYAQSNFIFIYNDALPVSYAGTSIEAGFRFPQKETFNGNIYFSNFLYKEDGTVVQSALKYQTGINTSTAIGKIVNLNLSADYKYSNRSDIGASTGIDHLFLIKVPGKKMAFAINPMATANFGTQNFNKAYVEESRRFAGLPILPPSSSTKTVKETAFNVLSYEFSAPLVLVAGKFNASIIPSYVLPQNLIAGERGENIFYTTLSVGVRF